MHPATLRIGVGAVLVTHCWVRRTFFARQLHLLATFKVSTTTNSIPWTVQKRPLNENKKHNTKQWLSTRHSTRILDKRLNTEV